LRKLLGAAKRRAGSALKHLFVASPVPLAAKVWAIKRLLPLDPWPRSLAYQQCLADRILRRHGPVVQSGPFQGMITIRDAEEGCLIPKLLGCYEEELSQTIENLLQSDYDLIIDVGCASGHWLTGLALRAPRAALIGFDADGMALTRCRKSVALNGVAGRVRLFGMCDPAALEEVISGRTLLFMDCDGPEYDLLNPVRVLKLLQTDIVVECHDYLNPAITPALLERFANSHRIERISSRKREPDAERYPGLRDLPEKHWAAALDERRPCVQEWLIMHSKHWRS